MTLTSKLFGIGALAAMVAFPGFCGFRSKPGRDGKQRFRGFEFGGLDGRKRFDGVRAGAKRAAG